MSIVTSFFYFLLVLFYNEYRLEYGGYFYGIKIMDGNEACARVAYMFTDVAGIYPITPSSPMAELTDSWAKSEKLNFFGHPEHAI